MKKNAFYAMFVDLLRDMFDAENQLTQALPQVIQAASHQELKEALSDHLQETKVHVERLKEIFSMLQETPTGVRCKAMAGLVAEGQESISKSMPPAVKDASLIIGCQKIEHYEISSYGSASAIAHQLNGTGTNDETDFNMISDLLKLTLDEESAANEKLTSVAQGGFFTKGINDEAEEE